MRGEDVLVWRGRCVNSGSKGLSALGEEGVLLVGGEDVLLGGEEDVSSSRRRCVRAGMHSMMKGRLALDYLR